MSKDVILGIEHILTKIFRFLKKPFSAWRGFFFLLAELGGDVNIKDDAG